MPTRVVIAEDEAIIRLDLKEILLSAGYEVVGETGRGDQAVTLVDEHRPDLAILDLKMPGMDGVRAAREITGRHKVAVLVLTAFSQRELIEDARDAGVAAYLVKPFRREELLPAIEEVLSRCRQEWAIDEEVDALDPATGGRPGASRGQDRRPGAWWTRPRGPHGPPRPQRAGRLRLRPADRHADPCPDARRRPAGRRRRTAALTR